MVLDASLVGYNEALFWLLGGSTLHKDTYITQRMLLVSVYSKPVSQCILRDYNEIKKVESRLTLSDGLLKSIELKSLNRPTSYVICIFL